MKKWDVIGIIFNIRTILDDEHVQHFGVKMLISGDNTWGFVKVPTNNYYKKKSDNLSNFELISVRFAYHLRYFQSGHGFVTCLSTYHSPNMET